MEYVGDAFDKQQMDVHADIASETPDCSKITGVNEAFKAKKSLSGLMAGEKEFELVFYSMLVAYGLYYKDSSVEEHSL
jgi:hypothetical protein